MWNAVDELLLRGIEQNAYPGCAMAVGQGDRMLYSAVHGHLSRDSVCEVKDTTRYDVNTLTQVLVTVPLLLVALERGLISLDDPISAYVDSVPQDKRDITLATLLTHTAGMTPHFLLPQESDGDLDALHTLLSHPLAGSVGGKVRDSDMGFTLLGFILENIFHMPIDTAMKRYIITPLGMTRTGFLPSGEDVAPTESQSDAEEWQAGFPCNDNARFLHGVAGHAGLFTSLADASRIASMFASGGRFPAGAPLCERAIHLATTDRTRNLNEARGLGFHITKRSDPFLGLLWPSDGCGLQDTATGSLIALNPSNGFYVVLLCNGRGTPHNKRNGERFHKLLLNAAYAAYQHGCLFLNKS